MTSTEKTFKKFKSETNLEFKTNFLTTSLILKTGTDGELFHGLPDCTAQICFNWFVKEFGGSTVKFDNGFKERLLTGCYSRFLGPNVISSPEVSHWRRITAVNTSSGGKHDQMEDELYALEKQRLGDLNKSQERLSRLSKRLEAFKQDATQVLSLMRRARGTVVTSRTLSSRNGLTSSRVGRMSLKFRKVSVLSKLKHNAEQDQSAIVNAEVKFVRKRIVLENSPAFTDVFQKGRHNRSESIGTDAIKLIQTAPNSGAFALKRKNKIKAKQPLALVSTENFQPEENRGLEIYEMLEYEDLENLQNASKDLYKTYADVLEQIALQERVLLAKFEEASKAYNREMKSHEQLKSKLRRKLEREYLVALEKLENLKENLIKPNQEGP